MENKQIIKDVMEKTSPKRKVIRNALFAFLFGGCVSLVGQEFLFLYQDILKLEKVFECVLFRGCKITGFNYYYDVLCYNPKQKYIKQLDEV